MNAHKENTRARGPRTSRELGDRPKRIPVHGRRDILEVLNKDPNYHYRFVKDKNLDGSRIQRYKMGGYELVEKGDHVVGSELLLSHGVDGDHTYIRALESSGEHLYLMRIPIEWHEEDKENYHSEIDEAESHMFRRLEDGQYGEVKTRKGREV